MAFVPVPATVKCSFFYTLNGEPAMNRFHVSVGATLPSQGDCQTIANNLDTWWQGNVQAIISSSMAIREIECVSIAEENGPQATFSSGYPIAGALSSPSLPGNNALCVSLRSGLTGRSARGRWFWCGLTEGQVTGNVVGTGDVTSILAAMNNLLTTITSLSAQPVIVSYVSGGVPRPGGPVKFIINQAIAVDSTIDSQRGRLH